MSCKQNSPKGEGPFLGCYVPAGPVSPGLGAQLPGAVPDASPESWTLNAA